MKIKILTTGKIREDWLEMGIAEYIKRLQPLAAIQFQIARDDQQLSQWVQKEPQVICLDPEGQMMDSLAFSKFVYATLIQEGSKMCLAIGGAEGWPSNIKENHPLISLSPLTFTHQMTRLILVEQLYRAFEIVKGSNYHK